MNTPEEEHIAYVVVEQMNTNPAPTVKRIKLMNTPEEEQITYIAVEPNKSNTMQAMKPQLAAGDSSGSGNLEKVRDILFGNQIREFDKKFNRLEERFLNECTNLRNDTKKRLDSLEAYIKQEIESLTAEIKTQQNTSEEALKEINQSVKDSTKSLETETKKRLESLDSQIKQEFNTLTEQIKTEQAERDEAIERVTQHIQDTTKNIEKKIAHLDEQTAQKQRDMRQQVLEQANSFDNEIQSKYTQIVALIEKEVQDVRNEKMDRATLANFLTQMAMQLNNEFDVLGND